MHTDMYMCIVNQERELKTEMDGLNIVDEDMLENWI